jgi:predicted ATP-dependent endonuclease of OLD family
MKLVSVIVSDFQSVRNSNSFNIGDITCLVGKNESGKTAILQALYRLNPVVSTQGKFDVTEDYPRADVENYLQDVEAGRKTPAIVIEAHFMLMPHEIAEIENEFGKDVLEGKELVLKKGYDNKVNYSLSVDEKKALEIIIKNAKLSAPLSEEFRKSTTLEALNIQIAQITDANSIEQFKNLKTQVQSIIQAK